jgi:hypothetical protein
MDKKMLGILAAILGGGVSDQLGWTGGESGQTKPQKRQSAAQADIAELMSQMMALRNRMTGPTLKNGQLTGPVVDALAQAMSNMKQTQNIPRQRLQAASFNPFAGAATVGGPGDVRQERPSQRQTFGPSSGRVS